MPQIFTNQARISRTNDYWPISLRVPYNRTCMPLLASTYRLSRNIYSFTLHFNIIFSHTRMSSSWSLPFSFQTQFLCTCYNFCVFYLFLPFFVLYFVILERPVSVTLAARSKARVCGRSPAEIVGSNPSGCMDVRLL